MKNIILKSLGLIFSIISIVIALWLVASFLEIVCHNLTPGYEYSDLNLIIKYIETFLM